MSHEISMTTAHRSGKATIHVPGAHCSAVHRKHHARVETSKNPHNPQIHGIGRLLLAGVFLYVSESRDRDTIEKYGHSAPNDWIETHLYF